MPKNKYELHFEGWQRSPDIELKGEPPHKISLSTLFDVIQEVTLGPVNWDVVYHIIRNNKHQ